jgi:hypothetical protein
VTQAEVDEIQLLLETINQTESDLENKIFTNYQEYPSAGIVLKVLFCDGFNDFHEGMHWRYNEYS